MFSLNATLVMSQQHHKTGTSFKGTDLESNHALTSSSPFRIAFIAHTITTITVSTHSFVFQPRIHRYNGSMVNAGQPAAPTNGVEKNRGWSDVPKWRHNRPQDVGSKTISDKNSGR